MIISIAGYMGSGKSHIVKKLSQKTGIMSIDLDKEISAQNAMRIEEIFKSKGEVFFRKEERRVLEELLNRNEDAILSLGGGTPAYFDNMDLINRKSESIYLRASVNTLFSRLKLQKSKRPLIAKISDDELSEFIAKHLFERNTFYSKCKHVVDTDQKTPEDICNEIIRLLGW